MIINTSSILTVILYRFNYDSILQNREQTSFTTRSAGNCIRCNRNHSTTLNRPDGRPFRLQNTLFWVLHRRDSLCTFAPSKAKLFFNHFRQDKNECNNCYLWFLYRNMRGYRRKDSQEIRLRGHQRAGSFCRYNQQLPESDSWNIDMG